MQERALFDMEEDNRRLKKEIAATKSDCENMLQIMEDNEAQIASYQKKQREVETLINESKLKIEEAAIEKDRVLLKEQ